MTKERLIRDIVGVIFFIAMFAFIFDQFGNREFKPHIAECKKMKDVKMIVEGRLYKKDKKLRGLPKSYVKGDKLDRVGQQPKPIYMFKSRFSYRGFKSGGRTNNNSTFAYIIREGEAPPDALGKEALLCLAGSRPRIIKAIYIDD